ncbi:MAG: hypothetical protein IKS36_01170 [Bacteroidales bacterium]|nr:hypothetical protein [Bacteroidales bacterium]
MAWAYSKSAETWLCCHTALDASATHISTFLFLDFRRSRATGEGQVGNRSATSR